MRDFAQHEVDKHINVFETIECNIFGPKDPF